MFYENQQRYFLINNNNKIKYCIHNKIIMVVIYKRITFGTFDIVIPSTLDCRLPT